MSGTYAEPFGNTICCDDIRQEVDGKITLVGTYQALMIVNEFPTTPPKLAFYVTFFEPKVLAQVRDFPVQVYIYFPHDADTAVIDGEIAPFPEDMRGLLLKSPSLPGIDGTPLIRFSVSFVAVGHVITKSGSFRVRARYGSQIIKLGSTRVMLKSELDKMIAENPGII